MKRREMLGMVAGGMAGALAAPHVASAQDKATVTWRCASSFPKSVEILYGNAPVMSEILSRLTDGAFKLQVFAAGELVPPLSVLDSVSSNAVEVGHTALYYFFGKDPALAFGTHIPFGLNSRQQNAWLSREGTAKEIDRILAKYNLVGFVGGNTGAQMGGFYRKEINSVEDLQGLKIRISGLGGRILSNMGAIVQQVAAGDIYPSLEKGTLDAAEFNAPHDDQKMGLHKVAPYYYFPGFWDGSNVQHFIVNADEWAKLPAHFQEAFRVAAFVANYDSLQKYDIANAAALGKIVAEGAIIKQFPQDVLAAAFKVAHEIYEEISAENEDFAILYKDMMEFQQQTARWQRISELAYDSTIARLL